MRTLIYSISIVSLLALGCDLAEPKPREKRPEPVTAVEAVVPQAAETPVPEPEKKEQEMISVEAKAGVTGKGQYGQGGGEKPMDIITVPVGEYWRAKERVVFDIEIPKALQLYKAQHDDKAPESNEEYMRDIIQANMIVLPKLPEGHEYYYDPETEKLMVRKPK